MKRITQEELSALIMDNKDGMYRLAFSILRNDADAQDAVSEAIVLAFEKCYRGETEGGEATSLRSRCYDSDRW